jgi:hypothetical protein
MTFDEAILQKAIDEQQATSFPDVQVNTKGEPCVWPFRRTAERIILSMLDDIRRQGSSSQKKKRRRRRGPRVLVGTYGQRREAG